MFSKFFKRLFGSRNERAIKRLRRTVEQINTFEPDLINLSNDQLRAKTDEFRARLEAGSTLDQVLPEAFAVVREASRRVLNMRHFDVQLIGGMVLHSGKIAEMRTGEGKTLVATLPVYLNALSGKGVHVITVNDYLARRDAEWMGQLYQFLGLTVGVAVADMGFEAKRAAYHADITYGTNNEFGFDYLRDNMAFTPEQRVQRELNYALIDEVDSILIDEARTPLIISGPAEESSDLYRRVNKLVPKLKPQKGEEGEGDYTVDEKQKQVYLTEAGMDRVEQLMIEAELLPDGSSLYDPAQLTLFHHLNACLRAQALYHKDQEYIVRNGQIIIVDEFTGRTMQGRRWSDGLHQAIEAKEGVQIQPENHTLASITFQNYFRLYNKLAGMTGTAETEAPEFLQIYGLEVLVIPTHRAMIRKDLGDQVFLSLQDKFDAVLKDIVDCHQREQPVLVGTTSIEVSEMLSKQLQTRNIPHEVLNAKQHEREADIVAQAGRPGGVTIATNMAGRGTDIVLGGNLKRELDLLGEEVSDAERETVESAWAARHEAVLKAGGLHIIGTERHESRRIDNQLRGRAGRQGDPGSSRFYLSLEDNLMRIFAADWLKGAMKRLGMQEGEAIEHPWLTRGIENAQRKVEAHNFDIRKNLLEYDDVANEQRKFIYRQRNELMSLDDISGTLIEWRTEVMQRTIDLFIPRDSLAEQWKVADLMAMLKKEFDLDLPIQQWLDDEDDLHEEPLRQRMIAALHERHENKEKDYGAPLMRLLEKRVAMDILDAQWKEHLAAMDYLRQGIHLRGYAQKNPKQEYKRESFEMFAAMLDRVQQETVSVLARINVQVAPPPPPASGPMQFEHDESPMLAGQSEAADVVMAPASAKLAKLPQISGEEPRKVGRNDPCPCGSGKKYKHCHGRLA